MNSEGLQILAYTLKHATPTVTHLWVVHEFEPCAGFTFNLSYGLLDIYFGGKCYRF